MKLIVLRHGQCRSNAMGLAAGSGDNSFLTVRGVEQSDSAARRLEHTRLQAIISSPLRRAVQTAEIVRDHVAPHLTIETNPDFSELDIGEATGIPDPQYLAIQRSGRIPEGGESYEHFKERVSHGMKQLHDREGPILLVSHQGVARMMEIINRNLPAPHFIALPLGLDNGQSKQIEL